MIKLNYDLKVGDTIFVDTSNIHANISEFQHLKSQYHTIESINEDRERRCYLDNNLVLDLEVAAYFNGTKVKNNYKTYKTNGDKVEFLPEVDEIILIGSTNWSGKIDWKTKKLWLCDYTTLGNKSGLGFSFFSCYNGGYSLENTEYWKYIR